MACGGHIVALLSCTHRSVALASRPDEQHSPRYAFEQPDVKRLENPVVEDVNPALPNHNEPIVRRAAVLLVGRTMRPLTRCVSDWGRLMGRA